MALLLKENIKSVCSAAMKPMEHRWGWSILLELTSINTHSETRVRINTPKVKFSSHLPQMKNHKAEKSCHCYNTCVMAFKTIKVYFRDCIQYYR